MSSSDAVPPASSTRFEVNRRGSALVLAAQARVRMRLASTPSSIHDVAATGAPLIEHGLQAALGRGDDLERRALQARLARVGAQRQRQRRQLLADAGRAVRAGEDVAALLGIAGRPGPVRVDHSGRPPPRAAGSSR